MLRWILLGLSLVCLVVALTTKSAFALGIVMLVGLVAVCGFIFSLLSDRVSSVLRPETSMASSEHLAALAARSKTRQDARPNPAAPALNPPESPTQAP
ncbi:hypothetical protein [Dokdonella sp.]|uniref:hypothetical protein n=1 Tax=Dokdonella sp. TaxID=2291710 RepID=UPI0025C4AA7D|nr:hypothetical protein [Dokdonella sp.]MBX3688002.1 hypothetical protein [Dokdonella sp.]